jgi:hypothetical protein
MPDAITQTLTPITDPPSIADPTNFEDEAEDLLTVGLPTFVGEMNVVIGQLNLLVAGLNAMATGGALSISYTFSTTTADADPGAGLLRLGSATQNTATVIRADLLDSAGADYTGALDLFDDSTSTTKGFIKLTKQNDATKWLLFAVTALASPSGYRNITASCVAYSAANPFANGDLIELEFTRNGDKGDTGEPGATGEPGESGAEGLEQLEATVARDATRIFLAIAELKGNQFGTPNGVADDFADADGVDAAASSGETFSAGKYANGLGASIVPAMTTNSAPAGYVASATSEFSASFQAFRAFDGTTTGNANARWLSTAATGTLQLDLPAPVLIAGYAIYNADGGGDTENPGSWTFQGWDGSTWTTLDTKAGITGWTGSGGSHAYTLATAGTYSKVKQVITASQGAANVSIQELRLFGMAAIDLRSIAYTAISAPAEASLMVIGKGSPSFTLNTDLIGYVSRDNGTTWTAVTLIERETIAGSFKVYEALGVDISAQPSGTSMRWRVVGSADHVWEFGAVSLLWS